MKKKLATISTIAMMFSLLFGTVVSAADVSTDQEEANTTIEECTDELVEDVSADEIFAAQNGWVKKNGAWYYYVKGTMVTGWKSIDSKWYYFAKDGKMKTGWVASGGKWYYMASSGAMVTGWKSIDSKWYYFASSGVMTTGWKKINNSWYYFGTSGAMKTGWLSVGDSVNNDYTSDYFWYDWYYFDSNGKMVTGWQTIGGKTYYFYPEATEFGKDMGVMATYLQRIDGKWYCFGTYGEMARNGWYKNLLNEYSDPEWVYANSNGELVTGWKTIKGKRYYFTPIMSTYQEYIDGKVHYFSEDGEWLGTE